MTSHIHCGSSRAEKKEIRKGRDAMKDLEQHSLLIFDGPDGVSVGGH
jgi:hypothetical protein